MIHTPIGIDTQITNILLGQSEEEKKQVEDKVRFVKNRIGSVISINGSKVYDPIIKENDIWYNLQECPDTFKNSLKNGDRMYYYPIQYAKIEFKETSHGKRYYQTNNVGMEKYTVSFHDGIQTHEDGSPFYGIAIFKNKIKLKKFISDLCLQGYAEKGYNL